MKWFVQAVIYLSMFAGICAMEVVVPGGGHATVHDFFVQNNGEISRFNAAFVKTLHTRLAKIEVAEQQGAPISIQLLRYVGTRGLTMEECELTEDTGFFSFLRLWHTFTQVVPHHVQNEAYLTHVKYFYRAALDEFRDIL